MSLDFSGAFDLEDSFTSALDLSDVLDVATSVGSTNSFDLIISLEAATSFGDLGGSLSLLLGFVQKYTSQKP